MKTLEEIRQQRAANAARVRELEEAIAEACATWKRSEGVRSASVFNGLTMEKARAEKIGYILRSNYKTALAAQVLPVILDLLQKNKGKKAGEKTLAKFRDELTKAAGVSVYFERGIFSQKSTHAGVYELIDGYRGGETIDIYTKNGAGFISENNEFCGPYGSDIQAGYIYDYIDDPEKRLDEIEQAAAEVKRIAAEYNAAADAYNALTVEGFKNINRI